MARTKKNVDAEENISEENISKSSVYEVGYLMVPTIAEENLGGEITSFKDTLQANGAVFISDEYPKLMELAYTMVRSINNKKQKFSNGYFGWVKFECSTSQAKVIKGILEKDERLIRYLFIKTVRENTMSVKRSYNRQDSSRRRTSPATPRVVTEELKVPINEESIDKEIEALVI